MKRLIVLIFSILVAFSTIGQNIQGYYVTAYSKLEAKRAFVIDLDTFYATTQLSGFDTIMATKDYIDLKFSEAQQLTDTLIWDATQSDLAIGLATKAPTQQVYETTVPTDGVNNFTIPFILQSVSSVYINYNKIPNSLWSGANTSTLTITPPLKQHDFITVTKN